MIEIRQKEVALEQYCVKYCNALGYLCTKLTYDVGIPDRLVVGKHGCSVYVEFKRDRSARVSEAQRAYRDDLNRRGFYAYIVSSEEDVRAVLYDLTMRERDAQALKEVINQQTEQDVNLNELVTED